MKRILNIIIIILLSAICLTGTAQKIAVKSNLLGWATATPTLGAEIGLDDRWTLNTHIYYNPFTFRDNRKWKHIRVQPEVRYWLCQKFNGHFFGLHVLYTHFNAGQVPLPFGIFPDVKKYRYQGNTYGAGLSYGYQWILTPRWSIEGSIGVGYKYNTFFDRIEQRINIPVTTSVNLFNHIGKSVENFRLQPSVFHFCQNDTTARSSQIYGYTCSVFHVKTRYFIIYEAKIESEK